MHPFLEFDTYWMHLQKPFQDTPEKPKQGLENSSSLLWLEEALEDMKAGAHLKLL